MPFAPPTVSGLRVEVSLRSIPTGRRRGPELSQSLQLDSVADFWAGVSNSTSVPGAETEEAPAGPARLYTVGRGR